MIEKSAESAAPPSVAVPGTNPAAPVAAVNRFVRCREAHQVELAEDYVELIAELIATTGEARAIDISRTLGVAHPTVTKTISRLAREGLVTTQPYRAIFLTAQGEAVARRSRERHQIVHTFLLAIGVSPETADIDAEGMEHHTSNETLAALVRLTRDLARNPAETAERRGVAADPALRTGHGSVD
ncbi:MAG: manganese-binding transcriptional regulator MntR [Azospirillaceae bacterium]|nr:manganese-binding transcriptional regulator MntR [Azospirillaceae bacterium]